MMLSRRPKNVRVVLADDREIPCMVVRAPEIDEGDMKAWRAIPLESFAGTAAVGFRIGKLPGKTKLHYDL